MIENHKEYFRLREFPNQFLVPFVVALTFATILALVSATLNQFGERGTNFELGHSSWWYTFQLHAPNWYLWALLTPIVVVLSIKIANTSMGLLPRVLLHLAISVLFALCFAVAIVPIRTLIISNWGATFDGEYLTNMVAVLLFRGHIDALFCLGIVGVTYAIRYRNNLRKSTETTLQLRKQLADARFAALQAQVRPHFLFNTLNSIATCMRVGKVDQALLMVSSLSELMRSTIGDSERYWIALSEEVGLCELYLSIEQIRFSDRLVVEIDVDSNTANIQIPTLLLQPIVENSVRYGVAPNPNVGRISVTTRRKQDMLVIEIFNNGVPNAAQVTSPGNGTGLDNVKQRLQQAYNGQATYDLSIADDGSSTTVLKIPVDSPVEKT